MCSPRCCIRSSPSRIRALDFYICIANTASGAGTLAVTRGFAQVCVFSGLISREPLTRDVFCRSSAHGWGWGRRPGSHEIACFLEHEAVAFEITPLYSRCAMMSVQASQTGPSVPATSNPARPSRLGAALRDLVDGLVQWRIWWILAVLEIRQRYRRSTLGQFWLTISMAATIAGIGIVFGVIFNQPLASYIPFLGAGSDRLGSYIRPCERARNRLYQFGDLSSRVSGAALDRHLSDDRAQFDADGSQSRLDSGHSCSLSGSADLVLTPYCSRIGSCCSQCSLDRHVARSFVRPVP